MTLAQKVPVSGTVIVTTPQDIALLDARKAVQMFRKVDMTVLGVVENMSTHICSNCGHEETIFGSGGGQRMSDEYDVPLLGSLPLAMQIRADLDEGNADGRLRSGFRTDSPLPGNWPAIQRHSFRKDPAT